MWSPSVLFGTVLFLQSLRYYYSIFFSEKIKDLLPQGSIDAMTKLVLVNAIYFKGNWEKKFPRKPPEMDSLSWTRWDFLILLDLNIWNEIGGVWRLSIDAGRIKLNPVKMMYQNKEFPSGLHPGDGQSGSGAAVCREESQYVDHPS